MGRLIKYEILKDKRTYILLGAAMIIAELYFLLSFCAKSTTNMSISTFIFVLGGVGGIFFLMVLGVMSYSRELSSKYSYMTFMTPNSSYKIIGAKYLTLLIVTVAASFVYIGFVALDVSLVLSRYKQIGLFMELIEAGADAFGWDVSKWVAGAMSTLIQVWISIFLIISCAYLAITFSTTIVANKKGKGFLTFVFFTLIVIIVNVIARLIPDNGGNTFSQMLIGNIPLYAYYLVIIAGTYLFVSYMLKKKISL